MDQSNRVFGRTGARELTYEEIQRINGAVNMNVCAAPLAIAISTRTGPSMGTARYAIRTTTQCSLYDGKLDGECRQMSGLPRIRCSKAVQIKQLKGQRPWSKTIEY